MTALISQKDLVNGLKEIGIQAGDIVMVHSDLRKFGIPENSSSRNDILKFYLDAFLTILGPKGTLCVPAYFYEYARYGTPFDVEKSPVSLSLGAFSAYVNTLSGRVRSCNPLQSIASFGAKAEEISGGNSLSGYGVNSPWHRLRLAKGKIVFLGAEFQSMTYVHYIEQAVGVPHMYWKLYDTPVLRNGIPIPGTPVSAVRYLEYEIEYNLKAFEEKLLQKKLLNNFQLGEGKILSIYAEDAFQEGVESLEQNIYFFLKQPPKFIQGKIPFDGTTLKK